MLPPAPAGPVGPADPVAPVGPAGPVGPLPVPGGSGRAGRARGSGGADCACGSGRSRRPGRARGAGRTSRTSRTSRPSCTGRARRTRSSRRTDNPGRAERRGAQDRDTRRSVAGVPAVGEPCAGHARGGEYGEVPAHCAAGSAPRPHEHFLPDRHPRGLVEPDLNGRAGGRHREARTCRRVRVDA